MAVSGVGGSGSTVEVQDKQLDDSKEAQKTGRADLENRLAQQAQSAPNDAAAQYMAQLQQQQLNQQNNSGNNQNDPLAQFSPSVAMKARGISAQVVGDLLRSLPSAQTTQTAQTPGGNMDSPSGDDSTAAAGKLIRSALSSNLAAQTSASAEEGAGASAKAGGLGSSDSKQDDADKNIQDAAKVAVYNDIYTLLQKMQNTRNAKADLSEKISSINEQLAGKKSGDKVKVPVYEVDAATGEAKFKGYKEMDYDQATTMRDKLGDAKDSMNEMSQNDMFTLQQAMEQKSQLEQMISNVMKANSETQSGLAGNLKAS